MIWAPRLYAEARLMRSRAAPSKGILGGHPRRRTLDLSAKGFDAREIAARSGLVLSRGDAHDPRLTRRMTALVAQAVRLSVLD